MWVSTKTFESLVTDRAKAEGIAQALKVENTAIKTTMDWMTMRLTQLEHERAALIYQYMGVKIPVPSIEANVPTSTDLSEIANQLPTFTDMGDDEASRQGYGWDSEGHATLNGKRY